MVKWMNILFNQHCIIMESKKSKKADLENKSIVFFQIGLIISIGLVILAFEWTSPETGQPLTIPGDGDEFFEIEQMEVIRTVENPLPRVIEPNLLAVEELGEDLIEFEPLDMEGGENIRMPVDLMVNPPEHYEDDIPVVNFPQVWPGFRGGGVDEFRRYVLGEMIYPQDAADNGISGRVFVQFIVDQRGRVTGVSIVKGVHPSLDEEAIRVISGSPPWIPGQVGGKNVKVRYIFPVNFTLK